ncbi:stalk domain-containing protein [Paenibacillus sediminis]|uniref:Copper amine oxidase-like N-terminal domain-containing protein n=1 Tax=Paenibacillus sediminis TaxID=664909 RepID=A0ABS4H4S2_9BACL|nr:stalk domain-containing protein [Paenibacillus sediminis]MBP1937535.1 hypothetical protein [Paenibacillus sediminis]
MKKLLMFVMTGVLAVSTIAGSSGTATAAASKGNQKQIEVLLNARKIAFPDAKPYQDSSERVKVPIRFVSEALGAKVSWNKSKVTIQKGESSVELTIGQATAVINGQTKTYDTKIELKQNRTFVPLRLVSEALGENVDWDAVGRWVWIGKKDAPKLEDIGFKGVDVEPYKKWFTLNPELLKNTFDKPYEKIMFFKKSDLPVSFVRDIYDIDTYIDQKTTASYLTLRAKATTRSPGNLFYVTKYGDTRFRYAKADMSVRNGDGTTTYFYLISSTADEVYYGDKVKMDISLKDITYIGFAYGSVDYIPLMENPWR